MSESVYILEQIEDGIKVFYVDGMFVCELRGGNVLIIAATFNNLSSRSAQRGDDYMAGVVAGLMHCQMTQSIPVVSHK